MKIQPVRNEAQYQRAKARVAELLPRSDAVSLDEAEILGILVEQYERSRFPVEAPSALAAIRFRMLHAGLKPRDLEPFIGKRSRVSEVLKGKRPLSIDMIRALNKHLGIPALALIQPEASEFPVSAREPSSAALQQLRDAGFIRRGEAYGSYLSRGLGLHEVSAFLRKSRTARTNAKTDHAAVAGWLAAVRLLADEVEVTRLKHPNAEKLARKIAKLSVHADGPLRAKEELARKGIVLVTLQHLPGTYLDGAALRRNDGTPVIAMTLRHDRIDNFWFTLLHELCHALQHIGDETNLILDDLELKGLDQIEAEADAFAQNALIPTDIWEAEVSPDLENEGIEQIARLAGVHPAIVAGRWQRDHNDYRRFAKLLGHRLIKCQFVA